MPPLPPSSKILANKKKTKSSMYMFTFSNNDEHILKQGALTHEKQFQEGRYYEDDNLTPTSTSGGAGTTIVKSTSSANMSFPRKKKSIFSDNQSSSIERTLHEDTFAFSSTKNKEYQRTDEPNIQALVAIYDQRDAHSKGCSELRVSSPKFRAQSTSSNCHNGYSSTSVRIGT